MDNKFSNMTKEEIVAMLKERDGQDYRGGRLDLSGCDLSWVEFYDINFNWIDFTGANLSCAQFENCNFSEVRLTNANMRETIFMNCGIGGSYSESADFTDSFFRDSTLQKCDFENADFSRSRFMDCQIYDCDFRKANLTRLDLEESFVDACGSDYALFEHVSRDTLEKLPRMNACCSLVLYADKLEIFATPTSGGSWGGLIWLSSIKQGLFHYIPEDINHFISSHPELSDNDILSLQYLKAYMQGHQEYVNKMAEIWGT